MEDIVQAAVNSLIPLSSPPNNAAKEQPRESIDEHGLRSTDRRAWIAKVMGSGRTEWLPLSFCCLLRFRLRLLRDRRHRAVLRRPVPRRPQRSAEPYATPQAVSFRAQ